MTKHTTYQDPYAQREQEKYENPVPSREIILELIKSSERLYNRDMIIEHFNLRDEDQLEGIRRRLKAMERDGQVVWIKGFYHSVDNFELVSGIVSSHKDGFGFLLAEDGEDDVFINQREMLQLYNGDRAKVRITSVDKKGRRCGVVTEVVERNTHKITGLYTTSSGRAMVAPDHKKIKHDVYIEANDQTIVEDGQVVVVEITQYPTRFRKAEGRIVQVLGDHMQPGQEIDVSVRIHDIPHEWPETVIAEADLCQSELSEHDKENRLDIRDLALVTIDGDDAKDFDDAVYAEKTATGWRLKVAIADVSFYVSPESALDLEAKNRGTSVYFPGRVVPMLPEALSNGLCSLNPDQDRLCMLCDMEIDEQGEVVSYQFHEALMRSKARLTYDTVAAILDDADAKLSEQYADLLPQLHELYQVFQVLLAKRNKAGAIDFATVETKILFAENKKIERIVPVQRNDAHRLIEECMLASNVCAADYLLKQKVPVLFRNHEGPTETKLTDLRAKLDLLGLSLGGGDKPEASDYAKLLSDISTRPDADLIQTSLLRSMSQAVYEAENNGHFGLSFTAYAHFTSPIRRYPDLLVHRAIKYCLDKKRFAKNLLSQELMVQLGEHCSLVERRADEATRDVVDWLKCEYMLDKVGEEFTGIITTVTGFGFFVEIENIHVEGLVHVTALSHDFYAFNKAGQELRGERTGKRYRLGDMVKIQVASVSLDERKIDFFLSHEHGDKKPRKQKVVVHSENKTKASLVDHEHGETKANEVKKSRRRGRKLSINRRL